jgi:glycosyltransferase involved in cell wall biosynthesis
VTVIQAGDAAPATPRPVPSVSVVVAPHNRPIQLARCVAAILGQEYPGTIECIVVFDKSDITPLDVPPSDGRVLTLMSNERQPGLAGARNTGILAASHDLVGFCDDDDEWLPGKLLAQLALLEEHPSTRMVGCHITLDGPDGSITRPHQVSSVDFDELLRSRVFELHPSTVLVWRKALLDEIGLVDEDIPGSYAEDYDWVLRAARHAPILLVDTPLARITWQTGSLFAGRWATISEALRYLLAKHPEFATSRRGTARILGQIAFAEAAQGHRREARKLALRALRKDPRERRAHLSLLMSTGLLSTATVLRVAHARGRGI